MEGNIKVANECGHDAHGNRLNTKRGLTTWALRCALGKERWWEEVPKDWHQYVDGLWRRKGVQAQRTAEKRKARRPLTVRYRVSEWDHDRFLVRRRRAGRHDEQVACAKRQQENIKQEVIIVTCHPGENDIGCRRMLYRARRQATHAVVAVVPDKGAGKRTEEYLELCGTAGRQNPPISGSEERLAEAFEMLGVPAQRQAHVGRYRLDFLIRGMEGDTDVEVDGRYWHTDEDGRRLPEDSWRDEVLAAVGIRTVRIWAEDVDRDPKQTAEHVMQQHRQ